MAHTPMNYLLSFKLAILIYLLLAYIFKTCKVYHDRNKTKNKLSYVPYILIMATLSIWIYALIQQGIDLKLGKSHDGIAFLCG